MNTMDDFDKLKGSKKSKENIFMLIDPLSKGIKI